MFSILGFYYDANSQYYFNSQTQQFMYWDANYETYLPADINSTSDSKTATHVNNNNANSHSNNDTKKDKKEKDKAQDKVKIAKKIAKDMEKWAKTLNQKKEQTARPSLTSLTVNEASNVSSGFVPVSTDSTSSSDIGFAVLEKKASTSFHDPDSSLAEALQFQRVASERQLTSTVQAPSSLEDPAAIIDAEENRLTDWDKLACLLCKRQFTSRELLNKHQQLSELHKVNNKLKSESTTVNIERLQNTVKPFFSAILECFFHTFFTRTCLDFRLSLLDTVLLLEMLCFHHFLNFFNIEQSRCIKTVEAVRGAVRGIGKA